MEVKTIARNHNWNMPTVCPFCGAPLELTDNLTRLYCSNPDCRTKLSGRIVRYGALLDWYGFGPSTAEDLVNKCQVTKLSEIYTHLDQLTNLEGYGVRSVEKLKAYTSKTTKCSIPHFLGAYGIRGFGETMIEKIVGEKSLAEIYGMQPTRLKGVSQERVAEFLSSFVKNYEDIVECAKHFDFNVEKPQAKSSKLEGMSFCFTGKACMPRSKLEAMVVENGGTNSAVKKGLTYLVTDDTESGSAKNVKAKELGIPVITSTEFLKLVQE